MKTVQSGFNLVELMLVVAIIGILGAIAVPLYQDYVIKAQLNRAVQEITTIRNEIETCIADGKYLQPLASVTPIAGESSVDIGHPCVSLKNTAVPSELLDPPGFHTVKAEEWGVCVPAEGKHGCRARAILYIISGRLRQDGSRSVAAYLKVGEDSSSGVMVAITRYNDDQWKCTVTNVNSAYLPSGCNTGTISDISTLTL
ncbi:MAG: pilin [Zoogloeaceae bacterium]|nr:pilin [Zoogloeaceae bacterium]